MNKSEAAKLGRLAVNEKYSEAVRKEWCKKGAHTLNQQLSPVSRSLGGKTQSKEAKAAGAFASVKNKAMSVAEIAVKDEIEKAGYSCSMTKQSCFEMHALIESSIRQCEIDFAFFERNVPKLLIEVTQQKNELKGEATAYKIIKLREKFPHVKIVCIIPQAMVHAGQVALKREADAVIFLEELPEIRNVLEKWL